MKKIIQEIGAMSVKDVGKVMSSAMKALRGKADGKIIQKIARTIPEK